MNQLIYCDYVDKLDAIMKEAIRKGQVQEAVAAMASQVQVEMTRAATKGTFEHNIAFDYIMRGVTSGIQDNKESVVRVSYILNNIQQGLDALTRGMSK